MRLSPPQPACLACRVIAHMYLPYVGTAPTAPIGVVLNVVGPRDEASTSNAAGSVHRARSAAPSAGSRVALAGVTPLRGTWVSQPAKYSQRWLAQACYSVGPAGYVPRGSNAIARNSSHASWQDSYQLFGVIPYTYIATCWWALSVTQRTNNIGNLLGFVSIHQFFITEWV